uniref:Major sperm protein n=1 Tax=Parastrongyloides trichosuri TaxID=131310 RepID=A0A0N4Z4V0_PARTI
MAASDFPVEVDPPKSLCFTSPTLGEKECSHDIKIKNSGKTKYAVKVKCTSNEMFKISPPVSLVKGEDELVVNVTFAEKKPIPENGKHYFAVTVVPATTNDAPRKIFADSKPGDQKCLRITVDFKKGEPEKKEEKKDEKKDEKKEEKKDDKKEEKKDDKKEEKKNDKKEDKKDGEKKE